MAALIATRPGAGMIAVRLWWRALVLLPLLLLLATQGRAATEESFDYEVLTPPPGWRAPPGQVELIEFFWYQCPHCRTLLPLIEPWAEARRQRVRFVRVPMALQRDSARQVEMYYALEVLGEIERLHPLIFQAIHEDHLPLKKLAQMADFVADEGVSRQRFLAAMRSPEVKERAARARQLAAGLGIREVPTMLIDRRYLTSASHVGGTQEDAMALVERLIGRAAAERSVSPR